MNSALPIERRDQCAMAMAAMARYQEKSASPLPVDLDRLRTRVEHRAASGTLTDWRDVLDAALCDIGFAVEWRGSEVLEVTRWT